MSYDIIKSIVIKNNQVIVKSACNNVYPKFYTPFHCQSLTDIFIKKGRAAMDEAILEEFMNGNFQGMSTMYPKALIWKAEQAEAGVAVGLKYLMTAFKKAWNSNAPVKAYYVGCAITRIKRTSFSYTHDDDRGKVFENIVRAKYALRGFKGIEFRVCET